MQRRREIIEMYNEGLKDLNVKVLRHYRRRFCIQRTSVSGKGEWKEQGGMQSDHQKNGGSRSCDKCTL